MTGNAIKPGWLNRLNTFLAGAGAVLRSPRWHRRVAWAVGIWLLVWALAYAAVPLVVKSQLERLGSEKLGRRVSVGAVDFRPWSLELTVHDLAIAKAEPASPQAVPQLKIRRLYIDAELVSLLRLAPVADALTVEEPVASLTYFGQGRSDIDDILERLKTTDPQPAGEGARFALYNLVLSGGRLDLADESAHATHSLYDLHLAVPFLSNLPSQREIKTAPRLAFVLNGSRFDTAAVATPFAPTRQTDATIQLRDLDLQPYLAYWPDSLPFRLQSAVLQADVQLAFEQNPAPSLKISGTVTAGKVRLLEARPPGSAPGAGPELLTFDRLHLVLDDVRPLEQLVKLSAVELSAPLLSVARDRAGRLNLLPAEKSAATKSVAGSAGPASAEGQNDAETQAPAPSAKPWRIQVDRVNVKGGALGWLDETLPSPARIRLKDLALNATSIAFPFADNAPFQFSGSLGLDPSMPNPPVAGKTAAKSSVAVAAVAPASPPGAPLVAFKGSATDTAADATATIGAWPLDMAAKYVGQFLLPALSGRLDADVGLKWQAAQAGKPQALRITAPALALSDVQLAQGGASLVSVQRAELAGVDIDLPGQSFSAASLQLSQPRAKVERDAGKRWMVESWLVARDAVPAASSATPAAAPWAVAIDEVVLDGGAMSFSDKAGAKPVAFEVTAANARLGALVLGDRPAGQKQKPAAQAMPLSASLRLATGRFPSGKLDFKGDLALAPLQAKGQLAVERLPVQAFEPYFAGALNIDLLRADASFKGRVAFRDTAAGPQAEVAGDAALESFSANTLAPAEELLAWKSLNVRGLKVALDPARATRVDVRETVLSDFFARVIVLPDGRINLQDLVKPATEVAGATPVDATKNIAANASQTSANGLKSLKNPEIAAVTAPAAAAAPSGPKPIINFGPISLLNGQVRFSDRFVKPNYSADLSELTGTLSAFSSVAPVAGNGAAAVPAMADLELRGKAEGSASLEITGKLNPLVTPLALDITGKVRDLELPPLSPYAIKYSGYGIERGKMSVDVNYVVLPNGQLTAKNKLVLNQLSFGDKAEGSTASLPVKLAVALLADRNGVIDLDLPISGSLNDPQFSLGPVIARVILNVITKAITAPFSLLARALGGGADELATVNFAAGSAQLTPDARAGLDKVAKALADRPALQLTVVGTGSLDAERDAFQREQLAERVRAEKRRQQGGAATEAASVGADEYPALLKAVYRQSELPKPRNLVGLVKDQPVGEMEKLLLSSISVSAEDLRQLAVKRGQAVKDYLVSRDLPPARLFLGAARTVPPDAKWTPHAELNLAMP
ncbi:DUF748 domain-containing protein [Polaromonas sp. DSR2-3-2]|uniref:DUF748 domain-containing protein n=1 Tax=unclassified Polaromonas TaxID=2638319 RepID=UPI003CEFC946